jgi:hypothetical protein
MVEVVGKLVWKLPATETEIFPLQFSACAANSVSAAAP